VKPEELERLLSLLGGDRALFDQLREGGFLPEEDGSIEPEHAEVARIACTLAHELEVNWAGVEVALHLRSRLVAVEEQMAELIVFVKQRSRGQSG
jgi:hypothetical protein